MIAILADIHANRPALEAVLAEARRRGASRLLVLGDVVGYLAEPEACIEQLAGWPLDAVVGNHDLAALGAEDRYANRAAAAAQRWTAEHLSPASRAFLAALPSYLALPWAVCVHGTFTHPEHVVGYITPSTADRNLERVADAQRTLGLFGHSHVPALHTTRGPDRASLDPGRIEVPRNAVAIFNPGSVGQPRDGDPRASFALFDRASGSLELIRVPYDLDATIRAATIAGFGDWAVARLVEAR